MRARDRRPARWLQFLQYLRGGIGATIACRAAAGGSTAGQVSTLGSRYRELRNPGGGRGPAGRLISIVIPVHAGETRQKFLTGLASLLENRTRCPVEIVVVVNGKFPAAELERCELALLAKEIGLTTVLLSYSENDLYKDISRPRNIFVARQTGLEASRGDIVVAADIDNLFARGWIDSYREAFDASPDLLLAYGPVGFHTVKGFFGGLMSWLSVLARAVKILAGSPPYQGANHAMRREVAAMLPRLYSERIAIHENEIPRLLEKRLAPDRLPLPIRCVPGAVTLTDLSGLRQSFTGLFLWIWQAARKNLRQARLHGTVRRR